MVHLVKLETEAEFEQYYQFRWRLLRAPHKLPFGSERDEYDTVASHRMLVDDAGNTIAVARMHQISSEEAQLRYIAVDEQYQKQGLGSQLVSVMEALAKEKGIARILINARLNALDFYQKCGFHAVGEGPTHFGKIQHQQMRKDLARLNCSEHCNEWGQSLSQMWRDKLPAASQMALEVQSYDGTTLVTTAPLSPNSGSDGNMFSGSLFGMCNLTAWGAMQLALKAHQIEANIRLVQGDITMITPVDEQPVATASGEAVEPVISALVRNQSVRLTLNVELYNQQTLAARFIGRYKIDMA